MRVLVINKGCAKNAAPSKVNDAPFPGWTTALSTGKDVSKLAYSEKLRILQQVSNFFILSPFLLNSIIWLQNDSHKIGTWGLIESLNNVRIHFHPTRVQS